jgi:hypothetical protein
LPFRTNKERQTAIGTENLIGALFATTTGNQQAGNAAKASGQVHSGLELAPKPHAPGDPASL